MIIVQLMGGLGNQMFQYATGLALAKRHGTALKLDLTALLDRSFRQNIVSRDYDLLVFNVPEEKASEVEIRKFRRLADPASRTLAERIGDKLVSRHIFCEKDPQFDTEVLKLPDETYLQGFFQDERYFADSAQTIRERFLLTPDEATLPAATRNLADEIRSNESICVHVRRADYVNNRATSDFHGICSLGYYTKSLSELRSNGAMGPVFVFSDDVEWCRQHLQETLGCTVVGEEHAGARASTHFWLMTLCQNFVIANSSFSWWAAWLAQGDARVCRPDPWFDEPRYRSAEVCPKSWIKIPKNV